MAENKIRAEYPTGHTGTFTVFQPDDSLRGSAGQSLSDAGHLGHYVGTPSPALVALDWVVVYFDGNPTYQGQYFPEVSTPDALTAIGTVQTTVNTINSNVNTAITDIGVIDTNVDTLLSTVTALEGDAGRVNNSWESPIKSNPNANNVVRRGR